MRRCADPDSPVPNNPLKTVEELAMNDALDGIRDHYRATGLTERLKVALAVLGPENQPLTPQQLAPVDQFHTRGMAATAELAGLAGIRADLSVLDVGSGVGGPARFLAAAHGCRVTGIDLSEPFVEAARYLTRRTGQSEQVSFQAANALELPFDDSRFDVVLLQHVAMNIADRARLYREIRRVLKPGGKFATFDAVATGSELHYPVPWARTPATSFLLTAEATRDAIEQAGFRTLASQDDTDAAKAWSTQLRASGPPPSPNLGVVLGPDFPQLVANLGRNLMEGRLGILTAVFEAASTQSSNHTECRS
jgi:SAM-dependent methyltransferase